MFNIETLCMLFLLAEFVQCVASQVHCGDNGTRCV